MSATTGGNEKAGTAPTTFRWSVSRELWEYRLVYLTLLVLGAGAVLVTAATVWRLPAQLRVEEASGVITRHEAIAGTYHGTSLLLMGVSFLLAIIYCVEALHAERRDRSILFWKSMPVSDLQAVLAKASIPILVLPLVTAGVTIAADWCIYGAQAAALGGTGTLAEHFSIWRFSMNNFYHLLFIHGLWYAPIYGWFLLVSSWAKRVPFLWAVIPPAALGLLERIAFGSSHLLNMVRFRFLGEAKEQAFPMGGDMAHHASGAEMLHFLFSPGMWVGLALCAGMLWLAARQRSMQDPVA